ncbi:MAG: DUF2298 domain-containing protein [Oscillospiraceae bacterium]|jgi:uncharacterized membrane protein|nr:DUF2298 domain-containing protein [Oscillospiraceae bacterium]
MKHTAMSLLQRAKALGAHWLLLSAAASAVLLRADFSRFILWWCVLFAVGAAFFPMTGAIFGRFESKGYIFSKVIGVALSGYVSWVLASLKILPFRFWALLIPLFVGLAVNLLISRRRNTGNAGIAGGLPPAALRHEALFMLLLAVWSYIRGVGPDIIGLEKFMDFGLVNSILRSDFFPPGDMWYAGQSVNYYYLGQYFAAYLTKLTGIYSGVTYNLMIASLFAFAFMQAYNIGQFLFELYTLRAGRANAPDARPVRRARVVCGALTGALVCLSGNLHTVIYAWLFPGDSAYWYPSATRYIGYNPLIETDGTIHEFPHYSYIVADLHAHIVNLLFALTSLAVVIAVVREIIARRERGGGSGEQPAPRLRIRGAAGNGGLSARLAPILRAVAPAAGFALNIFLIGLFPATNFWDFPIYITVSAALFLYANIRRYGGAGRALAVTLAQLAVTCAVAYAVALPFHLTFESIATKIALVPARSRVYQLLVLYGYQTFFFITLLVTAIRRRTRGGGDSDDGGPPKNAFVRFIGALNPGDAAALIIFICAIGLVILPELVYVVDIYTSHPRANTMFKLTFQAFVLFAVGVGYTFPRVFLTGGADSPAPLLRHARRGAWRRVPAAALSCLLMACAFVYPYYTISGRYGNLLPRSYKGLDGTTFMASHREKLDADNPDAPYEYTLNEDYYLIKYINAYVSGTPVIAEANGLSYTSYGRISAFTGLPDIFNWYTHEQLWRRSDTAAFGERISDLDAIYTGSDAAAVRALLGKYDVRFIVVGKLERAKFGERLNEELLKSLGERVFGVGGTILIRVD